jgi:Cu2+-containing amine oxidase
VIAWCVFLLCHARIANLCWFAHKSWGGGGKQGTIHYMDGVISDINGDPLTIKNAICIHEEDAGLLWKVRIHGSGRRIARGPC